MIRGELQSQASKASSGHPNVANHASKELRRRKRKPIAPIEAAGAVVDSAATPGDSATTREASQITRELLASLPPRRRAVMLLRYGWGDRG